MVHAAFHSSPLCPAHVGLPLSDTFINLRLNPWETHALGCFWWNLCLWNEVQGSPVIRDVSVYGEQYEWSKSNGARFFVNPDVYCKFNICIYRLYNCLVPFFSDFCSVLVLALSTTDAGRILTVTLTYFYRYIKSNHSSLHAWLVVRWCSCFCMVVWRCICRCECVSNLRANWLSDNWILTPLLPTLFPVLSLIVWQKIENFFLSDNCKRLLPCFLWMCVCVGMYV